MSNLSVACSFVYAVNPQYNNGFIFVALLLSFVFVQLTAALLYSLYCCDCIIE